MAVMTLPHTLTVERLTASGSNKELYSAPGAAIKCFLQPAISNETDTGNGSTFTKGNRSYVDYAANVKAKDRVTIGTQAYNVSGIIEHQYGVWPHKVLTLEAM